MSADDRAMHDYREILADAAELADEANLGRYTVNGERLNGDHAACLLAEFLNRIAPECAPHTFRQSANGYHYSRAPRGVAGR